MLTLFSKSTTEKGMDSSTSRIILEQSGAVGICLGENENTLRGEVQGKGTSMNDELDESYVIMASGKYQKIKSLICGERKPTRAEKDLISMIFNKMVDPYYYWAEARVKGENENASNKSAKESNVEDISKLAAKYDLDISEINDTPSRIKLKKYIDKGFEELNARMKSVGYSYERGSRSFVK